MWQRQRQIQTIRYGLNDTKMIKKKQLTLILYSFTPSDMNFVAILMHKVILAKNLSQKFTHFENSNLKYALGIYLISVLN